MFFLLSLDRRDIRVTIAHYNTFDSNVLQWTKYIPRFLVYEQKYCTGMMKHLEYMIFMETEQIVF